MNCIYTKITLITLLICNIICAHPYNLVDIEKINPNILLDIKYATKDNFTGCAVYSKAKCYLVEQVAQALNDVAKELAQQGHTIKIWDGYRPRSVQYKFWQLVPDERYVANPQKGSRHNRGCAIDVTLTDNNGNELDMGTAFDDFSEKAHRNYKDLPEHVLKNRKLLEDVMTKHNFVGLPTEWWHFDYQDYERFPLLNASFEELEN